MQNNNSSDEKKGGSEGATPKGDLPLLTHIDICGDGSTMFELFVPGAFTVLEYTKICEEILRFPYPRIWYFVFEIEKQVIEKRLPLMKVMDKIKDMSEYLEPMYVWAWLYYFYVQHNRDIFKDPKIPYSMADVRFMALNPDALNPTDGQSDQEKKERGYCCVCLDDNIELCTIHDKHTACRSCLDKMICEEDIIRCPMCRQCVSFENAFPGLLINVSVTAHFEGWRVDYNYEFFEHLRVYMHVYAEYADRYAGCHAQDGRASVPSQAGTLSQAGLRGAPLYVQKINSYLHKCVLPNPHIIPGTANIQYVSRKIQLEIMESLMIDTYHKLGKFKNKIKIYGSTSLGHNTDADNGIQMIDFAPICLTNLVDSEIINLVKGKKDCQYRMYVNDGNELTINRKKMYIFGSSGSRYNEYELCNELLKSSYQFTEEERPQIMRKLKEYGLRGEDIPPLV